MQDSMCAQLSALEGASVHLGDIARNKASIVSKLHLVAQRVLEMTLHGQQVGVRSHGLNVVRQHFSHLTLPRVDISLIARLPLRPRRCERVQRHEGSRAGGVLLHVVLVLAKRRLRQAVAVAHDRFHLRLVPQCSGEHFQPVTLLVVVRLGEEYIGLAPGVEMHLPCGLVHFLLRVNEFDTSLLVGLAVLAREKAGFGGDIFVTFGAQGTSSRAVSRAVSRSIARIVLGRVSRAVARVLLILRVLLCSEELVVDGVRPGRRALGYPRLLYVLPLWMRLAAVVSVRVVMRVIQLGGLSTRDVRG